MNKKMEIGNRAQLTEAQQKSMNQKIDLILSLAGQDAKRKALLAVSREIVMELIALSMDSSRGRGNHLVKKHI